MQTVGNLTSLDCLSGNKMVHDELALSNFSDGRAAAASEAKDEARSEVNLGFEEIFGLYHAMVFQLIFRLLGDREEALDVSQEVFLSIFRKKDRFRGESSLKTWIYRIAINRASNHCRWWNRLRRRGTVSLDEHLSQDRNQCLFETLEADGRSPEDQVLLNEKRMQIEHSLLQLPLQQRIAVIMRDVEGSSYEEIAESMQVSLGTVKSRIARGREELKRRLNGALG